MKIELELTAKGDECLNSKMSAAATVNICPDKNVWTEFVEKNGDSAASII
ncbi:hypothetical protein MANES_05G086364v8 [Manihot esculenta]|uniref:Uncharacterized protein n=1 Tax=Manihot esculenta TaxID=3983 RepID=A0ACB7HMI3_MANES|nr:hypothetical protein MANES_05G086364v8 [Manihot esculenta]